MIKTKKQKMVKDFKKTTASVNQWKNINHKDWKVTGWQKQF
jgi:hypothetical protein